MSWLWLLHVHAQASTSVHAYTCSVVDTVLTAEPLEAQKASGLWHWHCSTKRLNHSLFQQHRCVFLWEALAQNSLGTHEPERCSDGARGSYSLSPGHSGSKIHVLESYFKVLLVAYHTTTCSILKDPQRIYMYMHKVGTLEVNCLITGWSRNVHANHITPTLTSQLLMMTSKHWLLLGTPVQSNIHMPITTLATGEAHTPFTSWINYIS